MKTIYTKSLLIFGLLALILPISAFATEDGDSKGNYHAIFIAIDDYNSKVWAPLNNPVNDATQLRKVLKSKYGFATTTVLFNEEATRVKVLETLDATAAKMAEDDKLLIFYSGHGIEIGEEGYWVPFEAKSKERYELLSTTEVKTALNKAASRHILVMVDACFSSTILKSAALTYENDGSNNYYDKMETLLSRQALTAGGLEPVADGNGENSVFSKYILKFLQKNEKKQLDAAELFELIKYPVAANTPNMPQFGHIQNTGHEGGQFVFRLKEERLCDSPVYFEEGEVVKFDKDGGTLHAITTFENVKYEWSYESEVLMHEGPDLPITKSGMYGVTIITEDGDCSNSAIAEVDIVLPSIVVDILEGYDVEYTHKGKLNASVSGYKDELKYEWKKNGFVVSSESSVEVSESDTYIVSVKLPDGRELGSATAKVSIKQRVYAVQMGDNMERIARKFYKDPLKAELIYIANPTIEKGAILKVGTELTIPASSDEAIAKVVNLATNANFPPFSAENYYKGGMMTNIVNTVYEEMGTKIEIKHLPDNQVKGITYSGRSEIGFPFSKNEQDGLMFLYSEALYSTLVVFFAKEDSEVEDMEVTMKKRMRKGKYTKLIVAVPIGFSTDKIMEYATNKLILLKPFKSTKECFEAMKAGKVDLVAAPQIAGLVTIQNSPNLVRNDFKILDKSIETTTLHAVVSKSHPEAELLIKNFNDALAKAKKSGAIGKIVDEHIDFIQKGKP
jgi:hypothetical protein